MSITKIICSIQRLLRGAKAAPPAKLAPAAPVELALYPPAPAGLPVLSGAAVLATQQALVDRILRAAATGHGDSVAHTRELLERYAAYVHLLPATESEHFSGAGGLLRLGLETAYYSLRGTQAVIFCNASADVRQQVEPRWRMAVIIAGLLAGVMESLPRLLVAHRGTVWQPVLQPLAAYLEAVKLEQYLVQWQPPAGAAVGAGLVGFVLPHIVPDKLLAYISADRDCLAAMLAALSGGKSDAKNPVSTLVQGMYARVVARDMQLNHVYIQRPQVGARPEQDLLDGIRSLVGDGAWLVNVAGGRLWLHAGRLYLVERPGLAELRDRLETLGKPGVPADTRGLAEQLARARITPEPASAWWSILPAGTRNPLTVLLFAQADLVLDAPEDAPELANCVVLPGRSVPLARFRGAPAGELPTAAPVACSKKEADRAPTPAPVDARAQLLGRLNRQQSLGNKLLTLDPANALQLDGDTYFPVAALMVAGITPQQLVTALHRDGMLAIPAGTTRKIAVIDGADHVGVTAAGMNLLFSGEGAG